VHKDAERGIRSRLRARSGRALNAHWAFIHHAPVRTPPSAPKQKRHPNLGCRFCGAERGIAPPAKT